MADKLVELIKNYNQDNQKSHTAKIVNEKDMGVGGAEGTKAITEFEISRDNKKRRLKLVSKRYNYMKTQIPVLMNSYDKARKDGFPVPATTRFYIDNDTITTVMSDMTEGGKYRVWGYNDQPTTKEHKSLKNMALNDKDKAEIKEQGMKLISLADKVGRSISFHNYHIRQDIKTKEIDLFLLDLDYSFNFRNANESNTEEFQKFFNLLSIDPKKHYSAISKNMES